MLLLGIAFCVQTAFAQTANTQKSILFFNETVSPDAADNGRELSYGGYQYVLVQHPSMLIGPEFYGFQTLDYIPHHAAFARVASANLENATRSLENAGGRVLKLKDAWRLSKPLFTNNYNEYAWAADGQSLELWVQYFRGLSHFQVLQSLQSKGLTILEEVAEDRRIKVILDPENMDVLLEMGCVQYIEERFAPGEPENNTARTNHRIDYLQQGYYNGGLQYDGSGIMVAHNDAGGITDHIDFKGRFTQNAGAAGSDHGDHTAGTISAAGNADPRGRGMAPGADMFYREYPANLNNADNVYTSISARLTSNSFSNGCNSGYSSWSQQLDKDAFDNPLMLHVFSAGNNGAASCGSNDYGAGIGWGNITGGHKMGKNVVTVGNVTRTDGLAGSSSRGPATDGRIKPDITAVGTQVYSTTDANGPNTYNSKTGTSMSCPGVTGSLAVLMEAYKDLNSGNEANGTLLKGIIMNTADDLGNAGPDFRYGYGRINNRRAFDVIENGWYMMDSLATGDSASFSFNIPANTAQARFMVIWADPEASPAAARAIVNDLDMELSFNGSNYQPWVLNPTANSASLNSPATRQRDSLNNIEQVTIDDPAAGAATVTVRGYNVPVGGNQKFYVIAYYETKELVLTYPFDGMAFPTGSSEIIRFDAPQSTSHTAEYSLDGGANWININTTANARNITWVVPNVSNDNVYVRVRNAFDTAVAGPMTIVQVPSGLTTLSACVDSVVLDWNDVTGASGYVVYKLGAKYMDSITYVTNSQATIAHDPAIADWYALAAVVNDSSVGYRSIAYQKPVGTFNCIIPNDLELVRVLGPSGEVGACQPNAEMPVVLLRNNSFSTISSFDVFVDMPNGSTITETVNRSFGPGDTMVYYFQSQSLTLFASSLSYTFYVSSSNDPNGYNDTIVQNLRRASTNNVTVNVPYTQDFEGFNDCSTANNCGSTNCSLPDGWSNYSNGLTDDIDWRTTSGGTPSTSTGPSFDFSPGTSTGKFLYLESSNGCDSAEAIVVTPCIDLDSVYRPHATIAYHMFGTDMGTFSVDVFDGRRWHFDYAPKESGNRGSVWRTQTIDLSEFSGKVINIRYRGKTGVGFRSDLAIDGFSIVDSSGIGLDEVYANSFRLYPNPSNGRFQLSSDLALGSDSKVKITDLSGAVIWEGDYELNNGQSMELDLSKQAPGMYLLEVSNAEFRTSMRLIKQ